MTETNREPETENATELTNAADADAALTEGTEVRVEYESKYAERGNTQVLTGTIESRTTTLSPESADGYLCATLTVETDDGRRRVEVDATAEGEPMLTVKSPRRSHDARTEHGGLTSRTSTWTTISRSGGSVAVVEDEDEDDEAEFVEADAEAVEALAEGDEVRVEYESAYGERGNGQVVEATVAEAEDTLELLDDESIIEARLVTGEDHESRYDQPEADRRVTVAVVEGEVVFADYEGRNGGRWHELTRAGHDATVFVREDDEDDEDEARADGGAAQGRLVADGGTEPQFEVGEAVEDETEAEDERGTMRVVEPHAGLAGEVEVGTTGVSVADYDGNEDVDESERVVSVVFEAGLDRNVPEWDEWDLGDLPERLDDYRDEWGVSVPVYDYPESRLTAAQGDAAPSEGDGPDGEDDAALDRHHDDLRNVEPVGEPDLPTRDETETETRADGGTASFGTATLRDGETTDEATHAERNAAMLAQAERELGDDEADDHAAPRRPFPARARRYVTEAAPTTPQGEDLLDFDLYREVAREVAGSILLVADDELEALDDLADENEVSAA